MNPDHYDTKKRKIEYMVAPEFDIDVVQTKATSKVRFYSKNEIEESFKTLGNYFYVGSV